MQDYEVKTKIKTLIVQAVTAEHLLKQGYNWVVYEHSTKTGMLQNAYWLSDYPSFTKVSPLLAHAKTNCLIKTHVCMVGATSATAERLLTLTIDPITTQANETTATDNVARLSDEVVTPLPVVPSEQPYLPSVEGCGAAGNPHSPVQSPISYIVDDVANGSLAGEPLAATPQLAAPISNDLQPFIEKKWSLFESGFFARAE